MSNTPYFLSTVLRDYLYPMTRGVREQTALLRDQTRMGKVLFTFKFIQASVVLFTEIIDVISKVLSETFNTKFLFHRPGMEPSTARASNDYKNIKHSSVHFIHRLYLCWE